MTRGQQELLAANRKVFLQEGYRLLPLKGVSLDLGFIAVLPPGHRAVVILAGSETELQTSILTNARPSPDSPSRGWGSRVEPEVLAKWFAEHPDVPSVPPAAA